VFSLTRRYRFSASHRLHAASLSVEDNRALYGKCDNPYGHGHDYVLDVSVRGPIDRLSGQVAGRTELDALVAHAVLREFDHRNLNVEVDAFASMVPTSECVAREICRRLKCAWPSVFPAGALRLAAVRIEETPRNIFEIDADEIE
jgi:6-pyruvoyltetrahydropterin/6-carboxytetrahydropterin synthase